MALGDRRRNYSDPWIGVLLALPLILTLLLAFVWPLSRLILSAFTSTGVGALREVLQAGRYRTALVNSFGLSAAASLGALTLAFPPAWTLARERFPGRRFLRTLVSLPLTFSGVLFGFLMLVMLGRIGIIPVVLGVLTGRDWFSGSAYTLFGLFLGYLYFEIPRAVMTLEAALRRFPEELDWAARTLGAERWIRATHVVLPYLAPALGSTLAITFSTSMGSFGVALILSRKFTVAPLEVYTQMTGFLNDAVAGALCLVLACLTLGVDRLLARRTA